MGKITHTKGKLLVPISQDHPIQSILLHFSTLWDIDGGSHAFPLWWSIYHRLCVSWQKSTHTMGKVWVSVSQTFPIPWVLLHFPILWEIYGTTYAFPICHNITQDGNWMGKKHPYYGESMILDFTLTLTCFLVPFLN